MARELPDIPRWLLHMVEVKYCGSILAIILGEPVPKESWFYGLHILGDGSGAGPCPICGLEVGREDIEETTGEVK